MAAPFPWFPSSPTNISFKQQLKDGYAVVFTFSKPRNKGSLEKEDAQLCSVFRVGVSRKPSEAVCLLSLNREKFAELRLEDYVKFADRKTGAGGNLRERFIWLW